MDVVGPLPPSGFARYLLMIVDRSTRWLESTPMSEATTHSYTEALLSSWISRFGVPNDIATDRGSAFLSEIWLSLTNLMGRTLHSTTAYNSAANGMVKRTHRTLKAALMADGEPSLAEKVNGEAHTVPGEFFPATTVNTKLNHLGEIAENFRPCLETYKDRTTHFMPKNIDDCDYVFIRVDAHRQPLTRPYHGPYKGIRRTAKKDWVTIDRLKPAFLENNEKITVGPGRPRIPSQNESSTKWEEFTQRQKKTIPLKQNNLPLHSSTRGELRRPLQYRD
ncbi:uncharacterized protein [Palaemon carinicauda]|uniref:uncharacterized protein n=1 Tax=Palaemon carinicauda TaxID=392227 RepID=UPI0035B5DC3B